MLGIYTVTVKANCPEWSHFSKKEHRICRIKYIFIKLGLYLDTFIIGHTFCIIFISQNKLKLQIFMTNVFWTKK